MIKQLQILLSRRQRRLLLAVMIGMVVAAGLEMIGIGAIPAFVALLMDPERLLANFPDNRLSAWILDAELTTLTLVGASVLAMFFILKNLYLAALIFAEHRTLRNVTVAISRRMFRAYLYSPYTFHLQRNPAQLIRNISEETSDAVQLIRSAMLALREGLVLVVVLLLLMLVDPFISLSVFLLLGTAAAIFYMTVRRSLAQRGMLAQDHRGRQLQAINQGLGAIKDAKMLGREPYLLEIFGIELQGAERHMHYRRFIAALPRLFLEVIAVIAVLLVAAVFVLLDRPTQAMLPVLALLAVAVVRLVPAFNAISSSLAIIRYYHPAFELVCDELRTLEHKTSKLPGPGDLEQGRLKTTISLDSVYYCYPEAPSEALCNISLVIRAGEAVAIIGPTGAGKSTLVDVILGLLTPASGRVLVNGSDIQDNLIAWQRQIGYIPQDIYLVDDSIRRNIAFGLPDEEIDDEALAKAVHAAHLESFVSSLPDGLGTMVGNRGIRLSGGQRQRVGIARALYHNPSVLVMDEATSALDNETERAVIDAVNRLRGDRTFIMIAHRLTTVMHCNRLFLLEEGYIKDQGNYYELIQRHRQLVAAETLFAD